MVHCTSYYACVSTAGPRCTSSCSPPFSAAAARLVASGGRLANAARTCPGAPQLDPGMMHTCHKPRVYQGVAPELC